MENYPVFSSVRQILLTLAIILIASSYSIMSGLSNPALDIYKLAIGVILFMIAAFMMYKEERTKKATKNIEHLKTLAEVIAMKDKMTDKGDKERMERLIDKEMERLLPARARPIKKEGEALPPEVLDKTVLELRKIMNSK